jgi:hypothetical protein
MNIMSCHVKWLSWKHLKYISSICGLMVDGPKEQRLVFVTSMLALSICATFALTDWLNRVCATVWCQILQVMLCPCVDSC